MSFYFPISLDTNKLIIVDSDPASKLLLPTTSIISTPYTSPVLAISSTTTNPNVKSLMTFPLLPAYDLNKDAEVHDIVTSSIYRQTFDSWMYNDEAKEILEYIKVSDGNVKLISAKKEKDKNFDSSVVEKKIRFLKDYILSRSRVKKILTEFVEGTNTNWYDIEKNTYFVKDLVLKYMKKKIKAIVEKKEELN